MAKIGKTDIEKFEKAAEIFKGFANPVRVRIIDALTDGSLRVFELADKLGCTQPIISQQLKILKSAGIVRRIRVDQTYLYELSDPHYADMIRCMRGCLKM